MPSKRCHVCSRVVDYPRGEWRYVSRIANAVCSDECVLEWIAKEHSPTDYLQNTIPASFMGIPHEVFSSKLNHFFRSNFELQFAEWLSRNGVKFEYEKYAFPVKKSTVWTPDFHLPDHRSFVEIKGAWGPGAHSKVADFTRKFPDVRMLLVPWTLKHAFKD